MNLSQKYRPTNLRELLIPNEDKQKIVDYIRKKKPILLAGGPGVGKTSAVYAVAKELDYDVVDINSSDTRGKEFFEHMLKRSKMTTWKSQLFFFDEADSMRSSGYTHLNKIIAESKHPVILAVNEYWKIPMETRKRCQMIQIKSPTLPSLVKLVKYIGEKEKLKPQYSRITSGDDYRTAISKTFYNSSSYNKSEPFKDTDDYFKLGKVPEKIDLMWLVDNLPQYYYGKRLISQMAIIKASDKYKLQNLLQFGEKSNKKGRAKTPYFIKRRKMFRRKE